MNKILYTCRKCKGIIFHNKPAVQDHHCFICEGTGMVDWVTNITMRSRRFQFIINPHINMWSNSDIPLGGTTSPW